MEIFKKALHSKIYVFVKFKSAINLEIRGQIKKKLDSFYLGYRGIQCTVVAKRIRTSCYFIRKE